MIPRAIELLRGRVFHTLIISCGLIITSAVVARADRQNDPTCYKNCGCESLISTADRSCTDGQFACHVAYCNGSCSFCTYPDSYTDWCDAMSQYYFCFEQCGSC